MHQQLNKWPRLEQWIFDTAFENKVFPFKQQKTTQTQPPNQPRTKCKFMTLTNTIAEKQTVRKSQKSKPVKFWFLY